MVDLRAGVLTAILASIAACSAPQATSQPPRARASGSAPPASAAKLPPAPPEAPLRSSVELRGTRVSVHLPPLAKPPLPGVVMLHSALGGPPALLGYGDDLAHRGFAVFVLDFFQGRVAGTAEEARALRDEANGRANDLAELIGAAYERLSEDPRIGARRRFLVGWSYGAAWATCAAAQLEGNSGTVAYYGQNFTSQPSLYDAVRGPLLLIGGREDEKPSPATLQRVAATLAEHGQQAKLLLFDGGHGFAEPGRPEYVPASAEAAWVEVVAFLEADAGS